MKSSKIKISLLLLTFLVGVNSLKSQSEEGTGRYSILWQPTIPLAGTKEWIDVGTWSGVSFEGLGFLQDGIAIGGEISHNWTYKRFDEATYNFSATGFEGAVTGVTYRSSRMVPILLKAFYYIDAGGPLQPYVSIGAGTLYNENSFTVGMHYMQEDNWGFCANAELGADYIFPGSNIGTHLSAKYNYANINSVLNTNNNLSRINFCLGITFIVD
ncbi:MAG: hypothetical protein PSX36_02695 [bacterium]|nr:hypothetical protein [bacterium]